MISFRYRQSRFFKHPDFTSFPYEKGSVIIDPWRYIPKQENCEVIHIGDSLDESY